MEYPNILKITYIGNNDNLAIQTNESTHYIQSIDDVLIACDLLSVFSEIVWNKSSFEALLSAGKFTGENEEITAVLI